MHVFCTKMFFVFLGGVIGGDEMMKNKMYWIHNNVLFCVLREENNNILNFRKNKKIMHIHYKGLKVTIVNISFMMHECSHKKN